MLDSASGEIAIQKSLSKITNSTNKHKLWGRCPRPLDSLTSLSESEREAERTIREPLIKVKHNTIIPVSTLL